MFQKDPNFILEIFPNVGIALTRFLCKAVTNCSAERSFSFLKRIKNYLRASCSEDRLSALATLAIEADLLESIDFESIIEEFAQLKTRKRIM